MATCFENLVKHLRLFIRQVEELKQGEKAADEDLACCLLNTIEDLYLEVFDD